MFHDRGEPVETISPRSPTQEEVEDEAVLAGAEDIMRQLDRDGDGSITKVEQSSMLLDFFQTFYFVEFFVWFGMLL